MTEKLTTTPDPDKAVALAVAATTPETFDFAAAVLDRSYPEVDVPVYLDERRVQRMLAIERDIKELENKISRTDNPGVEQAEQLDALTTEYDEIVDALRSQRYLVRIKGISPERTIELENATFEAFPKEFENTTHPMTGATIRTEVENDARGELFATLLRQAHIVSVTAPNGAVDDNFEDVEKVKATWSRLPLVARAKIDQAINESTIAVDYYRALVDEVF
jgi:hypothetical protein